MFVVLSYDIGCKRVGKALKICRKYLRHTHRSVFEGEITAAKLQRLETELDKIINCRHDSIYIYRVAAPRFVAKEQIGIANRTSEII